MTAQSMGRFAMAIERAEEVESARKRKRPSRLVLVAAGALAASAVGYGVVSAPNSSAQEEGDSTKSEDIKCTGGEGKITISKKGEKYIGEAFLTGEFKEDGCPGPSDDPIGSSGEISIKEKGEGCELKAKIADGEAEVQQGKGNETEKEKADSGQVTMMAPLSEGDAKVTLTTSTEDKESESAKVTGTGSVQGLKLSDCSTVPEGNFTVTNISGEMKGK